MHTTASRLRVARVLHLVWAPLCRSTTNLTPKGCPVKHRRETRFQICKNSHIRLSYARQRSGFRWQSEKPAPNMATFSQNTRQKCAPRVRHEQYGGKLGKSSGPPRHCAPSQPFDYWHAARNEIQSTIEPFQIIFQLQTETLQSM